MAFQFIEILTKTINQTFLVNSYNYTYPNQKYSLSEILNDIMYVLKTGISWRNIRSNINWRTLIFHFNRLCQYNIFQKTYKNLLKLYVKTLSIKEKILLTDTSFIKNNIGTNKLGRNIYFKGKRCFKLSLLTDMNGIPLDIIIDAGNLSEVSYLKKHIKFIIKSKKNHYNILMADKGYDSSYIRNDLIKNNIKPIIPFNRRNTKDINKIKTLNEHDKKLYKLRIKIENSFSWLKKNKRISEVNEKTLNSYLNFVYLAISIIIFKRL
jgi:transposase